jgi:hypothetical protein
MQNLILFFLLLSTSVFSESALNIRKIVTQDYIYKPYEEEGYFQGWNYLFFNNEYHIFITSLISNMGPGDKNHGIALSIKSEKTGNFFVTKEFSVKSLEASRINYNIKNYNNSFEFKDNNYEIKVFADDVKLNLVFKNGKQGFTLSGDRHYVKEGRFVRADVPFYQADVEGYMDYKGEVIPLKGKGGMEHLLTNWEVYKYSSRWEIMRAFSKDGYTLITGGFHGKEKLPGDFFKTFVILDKKNSIILSGKIKKDEQIKIEKESFSGYLLPTKEKMFLNDDASCYFTNENIDSLSKINVLSSISAILRFFVNLFFANPFILAFSTKVTVTCPTIFSTPVDFDGIHSQYLINPK